MIKVLYNKRNLFFHFKFLLLLIIFFIINIVDSSNNVTHKCYNSPFLSETIHQQTHKHKTNPRQNKGTLEAKSF